MTTAAEFRELGLEALQQRVRDLEEQLFRMRLQKSMGQLDSPAKLRALRRDLARVKTVARQKATARPAGADRAR